MSIIPNPTNNLLLPILMPSSSSNQQMNELWKLMAMKLTEIQMNTQNDNQLITTNTEQLTTPFTIDNLLKDNRDDISPPSSSSYSPSSATNGFTLETLQDMDRRSTNKGKCSNNQRCVCDICGKSYATTSNLSRHKQTHRSLDSPHAKQCPHCPRVYVSMPALSMHILTHNASHECEVCGKRFSRLWLLQGHLRSHSGIRPFSCAHCGKSFADRSNLRAHILTHTGDKRFGCEKCGRHFALRAYLNRHAETCK